MCTNHATGLQEALTVATALSNWATNNIAKGWNKKGQPGQNNKCWRLPYILKTRKQQQAVSANSKQRGSDTHAIQNKPDSLVITLTLQSTSGDIQEGETECWNTESWKEQGCAWMMAATLSWDSCPFKDNTFKISDGGISPMHCLTPSTLASNIRFPKGFFWKDDIKNKPKPLSFSTSKDSWRT